MSLSLRINASAGRQGGGGDRSPRGGRGIAVLLLTCSAFLSGCVVVPAADRESSKVIPRGAAIIDEGPRHLVCVAPENGTAFVLDIEDHSVVIVESLQRGDRFVFAPEDNKAFLNDKTIFNQHLFPNHGYRIYFEGPVGTPRVGRAPDDTATLPTDPIVTRPRPTDPVIPDAAAPRGMKIPTTAERVQAGVKRLTFTAPHDGEIYVQDKDTSTVVLGSTAVRQGDRFLLDPETNKGSLEGRNMLDAGTTLSPEHEHEIWFVPYKD